MQNTQAMQIVKIKFNPVQGRPEIQTASIDRDQLLETCYKHIDCRLVDVVRVNLNGQDVTVWIDDEGLLKQPNFNGRLVGFLVEDDHGQQFPLAGNLVLTGGVDDGGETLDIPELPFAVINDRIKPILLDA